MVSFFYESLSWILIRLNFIFFFIIANTNDCVHSVTTADWLLTFDTHIAGLSILQVCRNVYKHGSVCASNWQLQRVVSCAVAYNDFTGWSLSIWFDVICLAVAWWKPVGSPGLHLLFFTSLEVTKFLFHSLLRYKTCNRTLNRLAISLPLATTCICMNQLA